MPDPIPFAIPTNMMTYPVALLLPGPRYDELSDRSVPANLQLQADHLLAVKANIEAGKQLLAAPILTPDAPIAAMSIFRHDLPVEELRALLEQDPAIASGRFVFQTVSAYFPCLDGVRVIY